MSNDPYAPSGGIKVGSDLPPDSINWKNDNPAPPTGDLPPVPAIVDPVIAGMPNDQRASLEQGAKDSQNNNGLTPSQVDQSRYQEDNQGFRDGAYNIHALSTITGKSPSEIALEYDKERADFAKSRGFDITDNDAKFRSQLGNYIANQNERVNALQSIQQKAMMDSMEEADRQHPQSPLVRFAEWNTEHAGSFLGVPMSQRIDAFMKAYMPARRSVSSPLSSLANQIVNQYYKPDATEEKMSPDEQPLPPPTENGEIIQKLATLRPEQVNEVKRLVAMYAAAKHATGDKAAGGNKETPAGAALYRIAKGLGRHLSSIPEALAEQSSLKGDQTVKDVIGLYKKVNATLGTEAAPKGDTSLEDQLQQSTADMQMTKMRAVLRHMGNEQVNPIDSQSFAETVGSGVVDMLPILAAYRCGAATGNAVMFGDTMLSYEDREVVKNPTANYNEILLKSYTFGAFSAAIQMAGMGVIAKAFPAFEAAARTLAFDRPLLNYFIHSSIGVGAATTAQVSEAVGNALFSALDKDFSNDPTFAEELKGVLANTPVTIATMMILGGVVHEKITPEQLKAQIAMLKDPTTARCAGLDKNIFVGVEDSKIPAAYREAWKTRDVKAGADFRAELQRILTDPDNKAHDPTYPTLSINPDTKKASVFIYDPINGNLHDLCGDGGTTDINNAQEVWRMADGVWRHNLIMSWAAEKDFRERAVKDGVESKNIKFNYNFSAHFGTSGDLSGFSNFDQQTKDGWFKAELPYGSDISKAVISGWSRTWVNEDAQWMIEITNAESDPATNIHEGLDSWTERVLDTKKISLDQFKDWIIQTEKALSIRLGKPVEFMPNKENPTRDDIREAVTKAGEHLFAGSMDDFESYPDDLKGYYTGMAKYCHDIRELGMHVKAGIDAGEIPKDFHEYLANALGLPAEDRLAPKSAELLAEEANPHLEAAGKPTFSIREGFDKGSGKEEDRRNALDKTIFGTERSPTDSRGESTTPLESATSYLQGSNGSSGGSPSGKDEIAEWAKQEGRLVTKLPWKLDGSKDKGGGEHHAFFDSKTNRWVKLTKGSGTSFGRTLDLRLPSWSLGRSTALEYLNRIKAQNETFGDDIHFHGVYTDKHGNVNIITSQPDYQGDPVTAKDMKQHMEDAGFRSIGHNGYYRAIDNTLVLDLHEENGVQDNQGNMGAFDAITLHPTAEQHAELQKQGVIKKDEPWVETDPKPSTESGTSAPATPPEELNPENQTGEAWKDIPWQGESTFKIRHLPTAYPEMSKEIFDEMMKHADSIHGMWIDRMRVGDYKGIPLQGGMFYPTILENLKNRIVWAYNAEGVATAELNKAAKSGGYMKLMLMQEGNVIGNKTFVHCWFHDLKENIAAGKLTEEKALAELNRVRELFAEHSNSKLKTGHSEEWTSLDQAFKEIVDMPQQKRGQTYFQKSQRELANGESKIAYGQLLAQKMTKAGFPDAVQMVRDLEEPSFSGLPVGAISGIIRLDPDQKPMTAKQAGVPEHLSYGYVLKGEPVARMSKYKNVKDIFPEVPDYPLNWSTTPLDLERGVGTTFSVRSAEERQRFYDEIDKRIHQDPDVYTPIWERMRDRVSAIQSAIDDFAKTDFQNFDQKYREQGILQINAVINSLPKDLRAPFQRDWKSPYSGEAGNIFTKFSSLDSDKARTDFLLKTVAKAKTALDTALITEYQDRHQKLIDAARPSKTGAGEVPRGKLGADTHALLDQIQSYSHMDMAQVATSVQALEAEKSRLEGGLGEDMTDEARDAKIEELDKKIWLMDLHGGMSPTDADGVLKTYELRRSDIGRMGEAVQELKQLISDERFDFNVQKDARRQMLKDQRQQVLDIINKGETATTTDVKVAEKRSNGWVEPASDMLNNAQRPTALFRQILKLHPLADKFVQRIYEAAHKEADANIKFTHESLNSLRTAWGKDGKKLGLSDTLRKLGELNHLMDKTGIMIREGTRYTTRIIDRGDLPRYNGLIPDFQYDMLVHQLANDTQDEKGNWKIKKVSITEIGKLGEETELLLSPLQFVDALMAGDQPDARMKLERNGLTTDVIDKIRTLVMKSDARDVYEVAKKAYDNYDRINEVFRRMYGVNLPKVDFYSPLSFQTSKEEKDINLDEGQAGGASSQPSWSKNRGNFGGKLRYDNAWLKLQNHMQNVNYWVSHAEVTRDLRGVFGNLDVLNAIGANRAGHREFMIKFMGMLERDAQTTGNIQNITNNFNRVLGGMMSVAMLGGEAAVAIKHVMVATSPFETMSTPQALLSYLRVATGTATRGAWFGKNNFLQDPDIQRFSNQSHIETGHDAIKASNDFENNLAMSAVIMAQQSGKLSMQGIHQVVNVSAAFGSAVRYDGAYREAKGMGMSDEQAHDYAQEQVNDQLHETMNPVFRVDKTISRWGETGTNWVQMFAAPAQQKLAKIIDIIKVAQVKAEQAGTPAEKAGIYMDHASRLLIGGFIASGVVEWVCHTLFTLLVGSDKQKEDVTNWRDLAGAIVSTPFYGIPLIGGVLSSGIKAGIKGQNVLFATGNPLGDLVVHNTKLIKNIMKGDMSGKDYAQFAKGSALLFGASMAILFKKYALAKALGAVGAWSNLVKTGAGAVHNIENE